MSAHAPESKKDERVGQSEAAGLSRRSFLGSAAAAAAAGTVGFGNLFSGPSAAEAREVGPLIGDERLKTAYELRLKMAERLLGGGIPVQQCNGDEDLYLNRIGNFSKGLPHNSRGEVDTVAYDRLLEALKSGDPSDFELIPLAGARRLVNPQAGLAFDTEGFDPHQFALPPAPAFASAEEAGEMVELYWMALLRDTRFNNYASSSLAAAAVADLNSMSDFRGPKQNGQVTIQTLFRDNLPGALAGPYISQFLLLGTPFGAEYVERRMRTLVAGSDHMTNFNDWLTVQRGNVPTAASYDPTRRYIRNGRDLSEWVHIDVLFQAYFNACLILGTPPEPGNLPTGGGIGCPLNPGNPYHGSQTQDGFGTWGGPAIKAILCEVATRALKAVWFQKWFVHRRLRPEAFGGRIHVGLTTPSPSTDPLYPIHPDVLRSNGLQKVYSKYGTFLLPMAFPEGSPTHPAYGAGHATVAGACVTILKAFFDESFVIPNPVQASADGLSLQPLPSDIALTVGGELNKLASNIATGRNQAGVHWRTDGVNSLRLGEAIAIQLLIDHKATFNEGGSFVFTSFDGQPVVI